MKIEPSICEKRCNCELASHGTSLVVVTGGPGAGKTALLEMAKKNFCQHIAVTPESASIIFGGGFWRLDTKLARMSAQRAIFHVQRQIEEIVVSSGTWAVGLCDRGTLDGLAYWPDKEELFWNQVSSGRATELLRYQAVIHLRTPTAAMGYNHQNELRTESPEEARMIDERIHAVWSQHPRYYQIQSSDNFLMKAQAALQLIGEQIPECCHFSS